MNEPQPQTIFPCWAILELMGHRRMAGWLSEVAIGGMSMIRIDVPGEGDAWTATQLYAPAALYCITPTTEEIARAFAKSCQPEPVHAYEIRAFLPSNGEVKEQEDFAKVHAGLFSEGKTACGLFFTEGVLVYSGEVGDDMVTCENCLHPTPEMPEVWHAWAADNHSVTACGRTLSNDDPLRITDVKGRVTCADCLSDIPF